MDGIFKSLSNYISNNPKITLIVIIILVITIIWLYLKNKYGNIGFFSKKDKNTTTKETDKFKEKKTGAKETETEIDTKEVEAKESKTKEINTNEVETKEKKKNVNIPNPIITQLVRDINHN